MENRMARSGHIKAVVMDLSKNKIDDMCLLDLQSILTTPAFRLLTPLYGETDAGDDWAAYWGEVLTRHGWVKLESAGGEELYAKKLENDAGEAIFLLLGMYVDDGAVAGPRAVVVGKVATGTNPLAGGEELQGEYEANPESTITRSIPSLA